MIIPAGVKRAQKRARRAHRKNIEARKRERAEAARRKAAAQSIPTHEVVDMLKREVALRSALSWILASAEGCRIEVPLSALAQVRDRMVVIRKVAEGADGAPALVVELKTSEEAAELEERAEPCAAPEQAGSIDE